MVWPSREGAQELKAALEAASDEKHFAEFIKEQPFLSAEQWKAYYAFLRAYREQAQQRPFLSKEALYRGVRRIIGEVNKAWREDRAGKWLTTRRNDLMPILSSLIRPDKIIVHIAPPIVHIPIKEELELHPTLYSLNRKGFPQQKQVYAPAKLGRHDSLTPLACERMMESLLRIPPTLRMRKAHAQRTAAGPGLVGIRQDITRRLGYLLNTDKESLLFAFSPEELEDHVRQRAEADTYERKA